MATHVSLNPADNHPAKLKYPHTGIRHDLTPSMPDGIYGVWYEHQLPNGNIAVVAWLYEDNNNMRRTVIARLWNEPGTPTLVESNCWLGSQCVKATNDFMDQLATY